LQYFYLYFILKDRNDNQPQRAQRVDYNRLKRERAQEIKNPNSINPELHEYAYPFHYQSDSTNNNNNGMNFLFKNSISFFNLS
jgi:hypothetical protein